MKKMLKWLGVFIGGTLAILVITIFVMSLIVNMRQNSFVPVSEVVLEQLFEVENTYVAGNLQAAEFAGEGEPQASESSPLEMRLNRTLTREDLIREFRPGTEGFENWFEDRWEDGYKLLEGLAWAMGSKSQKRLAFYVGSNEFHHGEIDEARKYYESSLKLHVEESDTNGYWYSLHARLAWVEEDPEMAVQHIEQSLKVPHHQMLHHYVENAIRLSVLTESDALAEYYYRRWKSLGPQEPDFFEVNLNDTPAIREWIRRRHPEDVAN
jgi:hypothetical protein